MNSALQKKAIKKITTEIPDVLAIYQFGSSLTDQTHAESDIDFAVLSTKKIDPIVRGCLMEDLQSIFKKKVDLADLFCASTVFKSQVAYHGKRLFCKNKKMCDSFEMLALSQFVFLNDEQKELIDDIKKRGSVYG